MRKIKRSAILPAVAIASISAGAGAGAASGAEDLNIVNIEELTCRMYLKMFGEERDLTAVFLHGYVSALQSETSVNLSSISEAHDRITDNCIDKPDASLLETFKANRS